MQVIIIFEFTQFPGQVQGVPEEHSIQVLAANRANQAFDERMRSGRVRNRLDLLDLQNTQVGEPTVEAEQWIMIGCSATNWMRTVLP